MMKRIILKPREEGRILRGHPWVYDNEVERILDGPQARPAVLEPGELADVESSAKKYLGRAFVNPNSRILARIYSPSKEGVDKGFFKRRIREAIERRAASPASFAGARNEAEGALCVAAQPSVPGLGYDLRRESARIVFAEADFLPGLIIDRFVGWPLGAAESAVAERPLRFEDVSAALGPPASWLSVQFLSWGMDSRRDMILEALDEVLRGAPPAPPLSGGDAPEEGMPEGTPLSASAPGAPAGIIEKSTAKARELEGLPLREGLIRGSFPPEGIVIFENGLPFAVHLEEGQKTGHFLDQKENRRLAAAYTALMVGAARPVAAGNASGGDSAGSAADTEALDALTARSADTARGPEVLDACSYTGGFGIHAARAGAESVVCVDVSASALEALGKNAALNGVSSRIKTVEADVFEYLRAAERKKERYDIIILDPPAFAKTRSSLDGAVRGYKEINLRAISLLKPGGLLVSCSCSQVMDETRFKRMIADAASDAGKRLIQTEFRYQAADHPVLVGYEESLYLKCGFYRAVK